MDDFIPDIFYDPFKSSMKRTTRGEKILDAMVADENHPMTLGGKNFIIQTLDPNHDRPFQKTGWPHKNTRPSVLRKIKQSLPISAVAGGGDPVTAPWDVHIALSPVTNLPGCNVSTARVNSAIDSDNGSSIMPFAGLRAVAQFDSGAPVNWAVPLSDPAYLGSLAIDPLYLTSDSRVCSIAFEVTDTSAEINKQGMLTMYEYPQDGPIETYVIAFPGGASTTAFASITGKRITLPPNSVADAMLLPDSHQVEAKYGAYMVASFQDITNPLKSNESVVPVFEDSLTTFSSQVATTAPVILPRLGVQAGAVTGSGTALTNFITTGNYTKIAPTNTVGCILAGLNPSGTYNLTLTYIVETVPNLSDKALIVLTEPPAPYDPFALELYTLISARLPPGCMVGDNDSGEWFWNIVEQIADLAAPILGMIPHPIAQGAGQIAGAVSSNLKQKRKAKKKKNLGLPPNNQVLALPAPVKAVNRQAQPNKALRAKPG